MPADLTNNINIYYLNFLLPEYITHPLNIRQSDLHAKFSENMVGYLKSEHRLPYIRLHCLPE